MVIIDLYWRKHRGIEQSRDNNFVIFLVWELRSKDDTDSDTRFGCIPWAPFFLLKKASRMGALPFLADIAAAIYIDIFVGIYEDADQSALMCHWVLRVHFCVCKNRAKADMWQFVCVSWAPFCFYCSTPEGCRQDTFYLNYLTAILLWRSMQHEALYLHHHCFKKRSVSAVSPGRHFVSFLESEEDADTWHEAIVTAAILFLFHRKRGGCRHVAWGHCDGHHWSRRCLLSGLQRCQSKVIQQIFVTMIARKYYAARLRFGEIF